MKVNFNKFVSLMKICEQFSATLKLEPQKVFKKKIFGMEIFISLFSFLFCVMLYNFMKSFLPGGTTRIFFYGYE